MSLMNNDNISEGIKLQVTPEQALVLDMIAEGYLASMRSHHPELDFIVIVNDDSIGWGSCRTNMDIDKAKFRIVDANNNINR